MISSLRSKEGSVSGSYITLGQMRTRTILFAWSVRVGKQYCVLQPFVKVKEELKEDCFPGTDKPYYYWEPVELL